MAESAAPILRADEIERRISALNELRQACLDADLEAKLATTQRLVLKDNYNSKTPIAPSGPTDPRLYILTQEGSEVATTDATTYYLSTGLQFDRSDLAKVVAELKERSNSSTAV